MKSSQVVWAILAGISLAGSARSAETQTPPLGDLSKVGSVSFPTSCNPEVQKDFERGVALLHSFFYEEARRVFTGVTEKDPQCASAYWGIAMTYYHPIWTPPNESEMKAGLAAAEKALALAASEGASHERDFIDAIVAFYQSPAPPAGSAPGQSCHGPIPGDHRARSAAFEKGMERAYAHQPDSPEAAAFYALALLGTAPPGDPTLANPKKAAEILQKFYPTHRDHPGLVHYLIHSYDYPPLADRGLEPAQRYANIAPWVPHALHMPSHIFTRLGMWEETIRSNLAAADAARNYAAVYHPGSAYSEELHAMDYLAYGYLQTAQDAKAKQVMDQLQKIERTQPENEMILAYAFGAIPARYALERRQWQEAASLTLPSRPFWDRFPFAEAHVVYARALGAARSGKSDLARQAIARLDELEAAIVDPKFQFFRQQVVTQRLTAQGCLAWAEGRTDEAVQRLRRAAAVEDSLGKHPVSPGAIFPARELLAEALAETGRPSDALAEYRASLRIYPARFNGVYGAARAAELAGNREEAEKYYSELVALAKSGDGSRPEVAKARSFIAGD